MHLNIWSCLAVPINFLVMHMYFRWFVNHNPVIIYHVINIWWCHLDILHVDADINHPFLVSSIGGQQAAMNMFLSFRHLVVPAYIGFIQHKDICFVPQKKELPHLCDWWDGAKNLKAFNTPCFDRSKYQYDVETLRWLHVTSHIHSLDAPSCSIDISYKILESHGIFCTTKTDAICLILCS